MTKKNDLRFTIHDLRGFTLIELLVVIGIIGMLVAIAIPNFLSARQRASDSKKKQEMGELKSALRLYYNDYQTYPAAYTGGGVVNSIKGCGASGTANCDRIGCATADFAAGGTGCDSVYMKQFPSDLGSTTYYYQAAAGTDFCLRTVLDNKSDPDIATSQTRCASACGANCNTAGRFCACAD